MEKLCFWLVILFVLGLAVGGYSGNELEYTGITLNSSNSTINQGIGKIVDGGLTISYELARLVSEAAIKAGIDLPKMLEIITNLFWIAIVLLIIISLSKVLIYIYVLIKELKTVRIEKKEIEKLKKRRKLTAEELIAGVI